MAEYALACSPRLTESKTNSQLELAGLVKRREELVKIIAAENNRLEKQPATSVANNIKKHLSYLKENIKEIEQDIESLFKNDIDLSKIRELITKNKGIGKVTAAILISSLPELGKLNKYQIAKLAGLAPINRDSGMFKGKRSITGGRKIVRSALYMATLAAIRFNQTIREFSLD